MIEEIKFILDESYYHDIGISKDDIEKIMNFIEKQQKIITSFENKEMIVGDKYGRTINKK